VTRFTAVLLLADLNIEMAYDDFGAGQARLAEIAGARPKYVKFDIGLIRGIDTADENRLRVLRTLRRPAAPSRPATAAIGQASSRG
jgi:EAL domain-containing protein (putative c-di-GMP-specific phosphodiesterase class I)